MSMDSNKLVDTIKQLPYWRVKINPSVFKKNRIDSNAELVRRINECRVSLRGWDYPHVDKDLYISEEDWISSGCTFMYIMEYWKFFRSALFVHYFRSDIEENSTVERRRVNLLNSEAPKPKGYLEITGVLYKLTEICEFAKRLIENGIIEGDVNIDIQIANINEVELYYWDPGRVLFGPYKCYQKEYEINIRENTYNFIENANEIAISKAVSVYNAFNWVDPPIDILRQDQLKLLERKL